MPDVSFRSNILLRPDIPHIEYIIRGMSVKGLRQEMHDMKELVAELSLENRLLKKA